MHTELIQDVVTLKGKLFYVQITFILVTYFFKYLETFALHPDQNLKQNFLVCNGTCLHNMTYIDGPAKGSIDLRRIKNVFQFPPAPDTIYRTEFGIQKMYNQNTE